MMQSRAHSLIESLTNVAFGYLVGVVSQIVMFPIFSIKTTLRDNFLMGLWFTAVSIGRSYAIRRWFTRRTEAPPDAQAAK